MKIIILAFFTFFVCTLQRPADKSSNAVMVKFKNNRYPNGEYEFEFQSSDGTKRQEKAIWKKTRDGKDFLEVTGFYSYLAPDGMLVNVYYTADDNGYRVEPVIDPFMYPFNLDPRIAPVQL